MQATASNNTVPGAIEAGRHLKPVLDNFHTALAQAAIQGYAHNHMVKELYTY
jgi:hypothetical protein